MKELSLRLQMCIAIGIAGVAFYGGRCLPIDPATTVSKTAPAILPAATPSKAPAAGPAMKADPRLPKPADASPGKEMTQEQVLAGLLMKLGEISEIRNPDGYGKALSEFHKAFAAWFAASPEEAVQFLSASPQRDGLLRLAIAAWAKADPAAASAWLAAHTDTPGRDAMAAGLAMAVLKEDPNASIQWVASIKDPAQKLFSAETLGWEFYRRSDAEAADALGKIGLPESALPHLNQTWAAKLSSIAKRNAQNLVSTANAAKAAGGTLDTSSLDSVVSSMTSGINGGGQFAKSVFKVSSSDWTDREKIASLKNVKVADGEIKFEGMKP